MRDATMDANRRAKLLKGRVSEGVGDREGFDGNGEKRRPQADFRNNRQGALSRAGGDAC